jgi:hypothetical protein
VPIAWITDCHLDRAGPAAVEGFLTTLRRLSPSAVIVTGDVSNATRLVSDLQHLAESAGAPLHFVLGNHDHYGGSVASVRDAVIALAAERPGIAWLPPAGVVTLDAATALVGVDGWADGRHGDPLGTPLVLNDDRLIAEVAAQPTRTRKLVVKRTLADADAARLGTLLSRAAEGGATRIFVATHVPPFVEALRPGSREAHPHWHPLLVCGATGIVLRRFAASHPGVHVEVLAGHSHRGHSVTIAANLRVTVGEARYGHPAVRELPAA